MASSRFSKLFASRGSRAAIIGMIHVPALPGSPCSSLNVDQVTEITCRQAEIYVKHGLDGILVENMHDRPYLKPGAVGMETVANMTRICSEIRRIAPNHPLGIQILAGANKEAIAVAHAVNAQFIRAEGFVFSHVADEGWIDACAGELLRYRRNIGADSILVFTDVKKKHSCHAVTSDVDVVATAKNAEYFLSDGVILTGQNTGEPVDRKELDLVLEAVDIPVLVGSGATMDNVTQYLHCHAIIVGSHFKYNGLWSNDIDHDSVYRFIDRVHSYTCD